MWLIVAIIGEIFQRDTIAIRQVLSLQLREKGALTTKGEDTHRLFAQARTDLLQRAFVDVTAEERRQFARVLQKMKANLVAPD
ncbi:hypothetical protein [Dickeya zeae]|uniref:hypothetical protein n=1 Tax=Dickeya zeae TaxID=204042 RepID=UPI00030E297B|nr:hypothetical protein [Dickeya zeae]AJC68308.1 hypothetical protein W909_00100 [Dickeya zeae EC1]